MGKRGTVKPSAPYKKARKPERSATKEDEVHVGSRVGPGLARVGLLQHLLSRNVEGEPVAAGVKGVRDTRTGRPAFETRRFTIKELKVERPEQQQEDKEKAIPPVLESNTVEDKEKAIPPVLESNTMEPCLAGLAREYLKDVQVVEAVRTGRLQAKDFGLDDVESDSEGSVVGSEEEDEFRECGEFWDDGE